MDLALAERRPPPVERSLAALAPHDHACLIFDSDDEQHQATVPFFQLGLASGDRCLCVADCGNVPDVTRALRDGGVDVDAVTRRGALEVTTERCTYLAGGVFSPAGMCEVLADAAAQARRDGFRALRIAGEVAWAAGDAGAAEQLMEYEVRVNSLLPRIPCLALCHYDRRRFPPQVIREVIRTHPLVLVRGQLCRNFYYVPPGEEIGADRLRGEVDRLLDTLHEHARAEEALRASERRLELVLEGAQHSFWDWDVDADSVMFDARFAELMGFTGPRLPRIADWRSRIHPDDVEVAVAGIREHLAGRSEGQVCEYRVRTAAGTWRWVLSRGRAVERDAAGRPTRLAGTMTDVTETRTLRARLELSSRLASVGTLAAGVAHEINNPLTAVSANLAWALEQLDALDGATRAEVRAALAEALDGAGRVRDIVQDLRRFAQPSADASRATADTSAELEVAAGIARRQVQDRARLVLEIEPALPPVRTSRHELGQVLVNLLVNAAQAIPAGHATAHEVRVVARRDGSDGVILEVSDTGRGIPADLLPRIFDPFYTTKSIGSGTGLGLAICHGIVQAAGGAISAQSEPGHGTTFRVQLPAAAPRSKAGSPPAATP